MTLEKPGSRFYLGLDLSQARDYSAIAVAERRVLLTGARDPITYLDGTRTRVFIRYLERIPLRTPYPDVVERVRTVVQRYAGRNLQVVMDATGVGAAVRDMLARAQLGAPVFGVTITGGHRVSTSSYGGYHVPRYDLLANLRVLLEKRMLTIDATGAIAAALRAELLRWGRRSAHDDLVFAAALACWKAGGQPLSLNGPGPLPLIFPEVRR
jgi:hypothetical protein